MTDDRELESYLDAINKNDCSRFESNGLFSLNILTNLYIYGKKH